MSKANVVPNPSRRAMLVGSTAALVAGAAIATAAHGAAVAAPVSAGDNAEIVRLADEIMAAEAESDRLSYVEEELPAR